jgi:hypothetical protein
VLAGLLRSRLPVGAVTPAALGAGCAGLALCRLPHGPAGSAPPLSGLLHRNAAGVSPAALPAAGMPPAPRLRGHPPVSARTRGDGMGAPEDAIARGIARAHGGDVTASSPGPGEGATFTLWMPTTSM